MEKANKVNEAGIKKVVQLKVFFKVSTRLIVAAIILSIICGCLLFGALKTISALGDERVAAREASVIWQVSADDESELVRLYVTTGDTTYRDQYERAVKTVKAQESALQSLTAMGLGGDELEHISDGQQLSARLRALDQQAIAAMTQGRTAEATQLVFGVAYQEQKTAISSNISEFKTHFAARLDAQAQKEQSRAYVVLVLMLFFQVVATFVTWVVYTADRERVLDPLKIIQESFVQITQGNLHYEVPFEVSTGEMGQLVATLNHMQQILRDYISDITEVLGQMANGNMQMMIEREYVGDFNGIKDAINAINQSLNDTLTQIDQASLEVFNGAGQMSHGSQALAHGAVEQAGALDELSVNITALSDNITTNAHSAQRSSQLSSEAVQDLTLGSQQMSQLVVAMGDITQAAEKIGSINKTIEDIAFQTNILALNAAIEAARAGAAGKGFAVVADEVKNLASKSSVASKDTTELIDRTITAIKKGTGIASSTAETLQKAVTSVEEATTMVNVISEAATMQADSVAQITAAVAQTSSVVQTNSATAEESAAASENLSSQSEILKSLVGRFQLK